MPRVQEREAAIPRSRRLIFATLFALAAGTAAHAQQQIGSAAEAHNVVSRELAGAAAALTAGDLVFRDEIVRTGAESTAKLVFLNSTNLAIGPTSRVTLDLFVYSGQASAQKMTVNLAKGIFRFTTGALDKRAYVISTPTASIGVRGTVLDIGVLGPREMRVTLVEGEALVCPRRPGITFEQQVRNCNQGGNGRCDCLDLNHAGQTAQVKKSGGANQTTYVATPVDFASLCSGGSSLCSGASYASLTPERRLPIGGAMRTLSASRIRRPRCVHALPCFASLAIAAGAADAQCVPSGNGGVIAEAGTTCNVAGTYTTSASGTAGIAGWATGLNALINGPIEGTVSFSTAGAAANALQANSGGAITLTPTAGDPGTVTATGANSIGLYATGTASTDAGPVASSISVQNLDVATAVTAADAAGARANSGGAVALVGGSVTTSGIGSEGLAAFGAGSKMTATGVAVTTIGDFNADSGTFSFGVVAGNGGTATISGGSITTEGTIAHAVLASAGGVITLSGETTVLTTGAGSFGLFVNGAEASLTATGISVTTEGAPATGAFPVPAFGAYNGNASPGSPAGGTMTLTDTIIVTTGSSADGIVTNSGGVTTVTGGSVATSGDDAVGLYASGGKSTIGANGAAIETGVPFGNSSGGGAYAHGVLADSGGAVTLKGGSVVTSGIGAIGLYATGTGSAISATDVAVSTAGSGLATANAIYANAGAVITVTGGSAATTGTDAYVVGFNRTTGGHGKPQRNHHHRNRRRVWRTRRERDRVHDHRDGNSPSRRTATTIPSTISVRRASPINRTRAFPAAAS